MSRMVVLALLIGGVAACGNGSKSAGDQQKAPAGEEKIEVPGTKGGPTEGQAAVGAGATGGAAAGSGDGLSDATWQRSQNPQFHLKPGEGTVTINKVEAKAGAAATAEVKLAPGSGYKLATNFPIKLSLKETSGVKVDKLLLKAGDRNSSQGDAKTLSEQELAFAVNVTPEAAGSYEIQGVFSFGVCEKDSCHPRTQPITIQVAAN